MAACVAQPKAMAHWSRHDPVMQSRGNVDHWAKLRMRSTVSLGDVQVNRGSYSDRDLQKSPPPPPPGAQYGDGRGDPVGNSIAQRVPVYDFHGSGPNNYSSPNYAVYTSLPRAPKSATSVSKSATYNNQYHQHAKQGFEFWYRERPKPTRFGRYGIGSYKTLLGLGNAPRT